MRVNDDYATGWNVDEERKDPGSVFNFWKSALDVRKKNEVLVRTPSTCYDILLLLIFVPSNLNTRRSTETLPSSLANTLQCLRINVLWKGLRLLS